MTTTEKTCFKCGETKPMTEFYAHPAMADGTLNKCKPCAKRDVRQNYAANREHYLDYEQTRKRDPERIAARKAWVRFWKAARTVARVAMSAGSQAKDTQGREPLVGDDQDETKSAARPEPTR